MIETILLATDGSEAAIAAERFAIAITSRLRARLVALSVVEDRVVVDGNVITSRGPGTSIEFALTLVRDLQGEEVSEALREGMLVAT